MNYQHFSSRLFTFVRDLFLRSCGRPVAGHNDENNDLAKVRGMRGCESPEDYHAVTMATLAGSFPLLSAA